MKKNKKKLQKEYMHKILRESVKNVVNEDIDEGLGSLKNYAKLRNDRHKWSRDWNIAKEMEKYQKLIKAWNNFTYLYSTLSREKHKQGNTSNDIIFGTNTHKMIEQLSNIFNQQTISNMSPYAQNPNQNSYNNQESMNNDDDYNDDGVELNDNDYDNDVEQNQNTSNNQESTNNDEINQEENYDGYELLDDNDENYQGNNVPQLNPSRYTKDAKLNKQNSKNNLETPDVINLNGSQNVEKGLMKVDNNISNLYNQLSQKYKGYDEFNKIVQNLQQIQNNNITLKSLKDLLTPTQNLYDNLNTCQKFLDSNNDKDNSQKINTIKQNVEKLLGVIKNNGNEQIGDGGQSTLKQLGQGNNSKFNKAIKTQANIPSDGSVINLGSGQGNNEDNNSKQLSLFNDEDNSKSNSNKFNTDIISKNLNMLNKQELNNNRQQIILQNKNLLQNNYNKIQKYFTELTKSGQKVKSLETQFVKSYNELYNSCINKNSNNQNIIQNINKFYKNVNKIFDTIQQKNKDKNFDKTNSKILISAINTLTNTLIKSCFNGLSQNFNVTNKNFITMREMKELNLNENKITKIVDNCIKNYFHNL